MMGEMGREMMPGEPGHQGIWDKKPEGADYLAQLGKKDAGFDAAIGSSSLDELEEAVNRLEEKLKEQPGDATILNRLSRIQERIQLIIKEKRH